MVRHRGTSIAMKSELKVQSNGLNMSQLAANSD